MKPRGHWRSGHATAGRASAVVCAIGLALLAAAAARAAVGIGAPAAQTLAHNTSDAAQVFPEATWALTSSVSELLGATVTLSTGPFAHTGSANLKADCRLSLRVLSSSGLAGWTAIVPTDQTLIAQGKNTASVQARSAAAGNGSVGLTVRFQQTNFSALGAGNYTVTVTGTIASNL